MLDGCRECINKHCGNKPLYHDYFPGSNNCKTLLPTLATLTMYPN